MQDPMEVSVRTLNLKKMSIPKIAVLATGAAAALLAATISPAPIAQAYPTPPRSACTGCHTSGGSVSATPSIATPAPGAPYTVTLAFTGGAGGNTGYWISGNSENIIGSAATGSTRTQAMSAPAAAGSYTYTVWMRDGTAATSTYTITVGAAPTTPPVTTSPVTTSPVTTSPVTTPPEAGASIASLSPTHGVVGSTVTIASTGFGTSSHVQFGTADAVELAGTISTDGKMVVSVPANMNSDFMPMTGVVTQRVWNRHARVVQVTVTPEGARLPSA
jgi:hypothetical protein